MDPSGITLWWRCVWSAATSQLCRDDIHLRVLNHLGSFGVLSRFGVQQVLNRCVIVSKRRGFQFEPGRGGVEWESCPVSSQTSPL